jgi:acetolactate synthase-1/2/3 large subunit
MTLSDYVIDYLASQGTRHVFGMSGGAAIHLFDSASRHPAIRPIFVAHEQSAAMAADGYFRVSGKLGASIVTSGPGATNLLTGICCSFYDSVPSIVLTGQVATYRLKGDRPVRQVGFQETDTLSIFSSVTKYGIQIRSAEDIQIALSRAYSEAVSGRPGPVHIDLPDDLQRTEVNFSSVSSSTSVARADVPRANLVEEVRGLMDQIAAAKRPAIVLGGGFSTPRLVDELRDFLAQLDVPILLTWAGLDLVPFDFKGRIGTFGVYGSRLGNFVIQHADLLVCLGTRLSQNLTGGVLSTFAPKAHIAMVDIDLGELNKFDGYGIHIKTRIHCSLQEFLTTSASLIDKFRAPDINIWRNTIEGWSHTLPTDIPQPPADNCGYVDANDFVKKLSDVLSENEVIFVDTGGNLTWTCNNLQVKKNQRVISAWNFTPMGYALPASIGGAVAAPDRPITCIIGDGGLQLCLGELATIIRYQLAIRIVLFNNHSHGIQKQTLETWLNGRYTGVDTASGLSLSDFPCVAEAMGLQVISVRSSTEIPVRLREAYAIPGPLLLNIEINPAQKLYPVTKSGAALENQTPLLNAKELAALRAFPLT